MVQVRGRDDTGGSGLLRFADGTEVIVTAHVTKEGTPQEDGPGSIRQRLEVETEQISRGNQSFAVNSGMRINVYQPQLKNESDQQARAARLFRYGERLRFPGKTSALLEGDAERKAEQQIAEEQPEADLLKVAHHGSAASTIPLLLDRVHPRFAVISVGARNTYGHPRGEVLDRLGQARVLTYRTDLDGAVTFYLDGKAVISGLPRAEVH